ncbi:replication protein [Cytobacillus depressus]|uniref:replication protein n=1 Tax=Cytobacillus depressus TaxID=1602942 RepID=UPI001FE941E8|nr:replication protein [Cytobacillus depressus]
MIEQLNLVENDTLYEAKRHVMFHHKKAAGWVTLAQKERDGTWRQRHFRPEELASELTNWLGENTFYSQNTFYKPQRRIENIKRLSALYVDVDCHNLNYNPHWVLEKLNLEVFGETIPDPNYITFSGRGLVCIWLIEPVPSQALPLWKAIQNYFYRQMEYVGADKNSIDPTRVFRVAGSVNSKSGREVFVQYRHDTRYVLRDLQNEYLPELNKMRPVKSRRRSNVIRMYNIRNLHYARLLDIVKLAELRNYNVTGYREVICFLYRYWSCCFTNDPDESLSQTLGFNSTFNDPLPESEIIRATKSAEKAWMDRNDPKANEEAIAKGYPGAGYNLKNETIIQKLDITPEEQQHLRTIIDADEKLRRKRNRDKRAYREKNGSVSRKEYITEQQEKTKDKLWQLKAALKRHPASNNVKLANLLGVSEGYIRKLKKKFDENPTRTGSRPYIMGGSLFPPENINHT